MNDRKNSGISSTKKLWGGRFKKPMDTLMETFSASISFDKRLYDCDIEGSIAHCKMLARCKIITTAESNKIVKGLKNIKVSNAKLLYIDKIRKT